MCAVRGYRLCAKKISCIYVRYIVRYASFNCCLERGFEVVEQLDSRLSSKYENLLKVLSYKISSVEDNLIYFFAEDGFIYGLVFDEKTPNYISIVFGISGFKEDQDVLRRYNAVQHVNENIKFVKVYMDENSAQFSCEQLMYDVSNFQNFIENSVSSMNVALKELVKTLRFEG